MSAVNPLLLPVTKNTETIRRDVLTNILKMLNKRKWIKDENLQAETNRVIDTQNDNSVYKVTLDVDLNNLMTYYPPENTDTRDLDEKFNGKILAIKLLSQKITSIGKSPIIQEFLAENKNNHKIVIVEAITDKSRAQIMSMFKYTEFFIEPYFMIDLMELCCSPQYEVLDPENSLIFLEKYNVKKHQLKKMFDIDPASLYFFLQQRQIVRIIRDSELTGQSIDYRLVIHKGT
jgi:DNA-directed RNA polymerase subunit H (RpoH/RPB5)